MNTLTHMLIETSEEMQKAITNTASVAAEQTELLALVVNNDVDKNFKDFTDAMTQQIADVTEQQHKLEAKVEKLNDVINACQNDENVAKVVTKLCLAFGMFGTTPTCCDDVVEVKDIEPEQESNVIHHDFKKIINER